MATIIVPRTFDFRPVATSGQDPRVLEAQAKRERERKLNKELHAWQMANYSPDDIADTTYRPLVLGYYAFYLANVCKRNAKWKRSQELKELNRCLRMMGRKFDAFNCKTIKKPVRQHIKRQVIDLHQINWDSSYLKPLWAFERYYSSQFGDVGELASARANARYGYLLIRVLERYLREAEERTSERYGKQIVLPMQEEVAWLKDYFAAVMSYNFVETRDDAIVEGILYNKARNITGEDVTYEISQAEMAINNERAVWWDYGFGD